MDRKKLVRLLAVALIVGGCQGLTAAGSPTQSSVSQPPGASPNPSSSATSTPAPILSPVATTPSPAGPTCDVTGHPAEERTFKFKHGQATLALSTGEKLTLPLEDDPTNESRFVCNGQDSYAGAFWALDDKKAGEWSLVVNYSVHTIGNNPPWVQLDAYNAEDQHIRTVELEVERQSGDVCSATIALLSPAGLTGSGECHGLRWIQEIGAVAPGEPFPTPYPVGKPFDLTLTFEAMP
jgi:hypothetical protein